MYGFHVPRLSHSWSFHWAGNSRFSSIRFLYPPLVWAYQPNLKPLMWVFLLFPLSFTDTFVMLLANASSLCHTQVGSLSLISGRNGRNSWEGEERWRGLHEKPGPYGDGMVECLGPGLPSLQPTLLLAGRAASSDPVQPPRGSLRLLSQAALSSTPSLSLLWWTLTGLCQSERPLSLSTAVALKYKRSKLHWCSLIHL